MRGLWLWSCISKGFDYEDSGFGVSSLCLVTEGLAFMAWNPLAEACKSSVGRRLQKHPEAEELLARDMVVKIMVPFWVPNIVQHLIFRVPKKGP